MLLLWIHLASGWETDPITRRSEVLADATAPANAYADALLHAAVLDTNRRTACSGTDDEVRDVLAERIFRATSPREYVESRPGLAGEGHGIYSGWLESEQHVDRRNFDDRSDLFGGIAFGAAPVLSSAGTCSLVSIAGVLMGTDKPDHFWYSGYVYYHLAEKHGNEAAIEYGTRTELTYYGMMTSSTFSYADLHANWRGWQFYQGLLGPQSIFQRDDRGCVEQVRPFDWADWVDWRWDEVLNPNVYTPPVSRWVDEKLDARGQGVCRELSAVLPDVAVRVPEALAEASPWAGPKAPPRVDPYGLTARCASSPVAGSIVDAVPAEAPAEGVRASRRTRGRDR